MSSPGQAEGDGAVRVNLDPSVLNALRVPNALRDDIGQVLALTDGFCGEHLGDEYRDVIRRMVAKLARKRPSPLLRGDLRVWAAAAIYAAGSLNFLFDRTQQPHLNADDLAHLTGVAQHSEEAIVASYRRYRDVDAAHDDLVAQLSALSVAACLAASGS